MTDPDRACLHEYFEATVEVNRIAEAGQVPTAYMADIRVSCAQCGEAFRWIGCRAGLHFSGPPMVSVDETELHAPLRPASADPDFGMGLPGYAINYQPGPAAADADLHRRE